MKKNKILNWYKNLSKKNKIYYFLWIFLPLFVVILVASLLGTVMNNYNNQFDLKHNTTTVMSENYNNVFSKSDVAGETNNNLLELNTNSLSSILAQDFKNNNHESGYSPIDWTSKLDKNDLYVYLVFFQNNQPEYIQLLFNQNSNNTNLLHSLNNNSGVEIGLYNSNYTKNSSNALSISNNLFFNDNNITPYNKNNEVYAFNYLTSSFINYCFTNSLNNNIYLYISQIQDFTGQFADLEISLTN